MKEIIDLLKEATDSIHDKQSYHEALSKNDYYLLSRIEDKIAELEQGGYVLYQP